MPWLEKIRHKPHQEKIRLIWIAALVAAVVLLGLWLLLGGAKKRAAPDTTVFRTFVRGIEDFSRQLKNLKR